MKIIFKILVSLLLFSNSFLSFGFSGGITNSGSYDIIDEQRKVGETLNDEEELGNTKKLDTNSGSVNSEETGTLELESLSGATEGSQTGTEKLYNNLPDFSFIFQQPTYLLEKDLIKQNYDCYREQCKVNIKLEDSNGTDISSKYYCEIDFGFGADILKTCNPTTIVFPIGEYQSIFKVLEKDNPDSFIEKSIIIKNILNEEIIEEETGTGEIEETNSGTLIIDLEESGTGEIEETSFSGDTFEISDIEIEIQSGLEYLSGNIWQCEKEDCKINLNAEKNFSDIFLEKDYECFWDFGGGTFNTTDTDKKCNPGYVDYETGEYEIILNISEKDNPDSFIEKSIIIKNILNEEIIEEETGTGEIEETNSGTLIIDLEESGTGEIEETSFSGDTFEISDIEIEIQSGLEYLSGNIWQCEKEDCKINLNAEKNFSDIFLEKDYECFWDFGGGTFNTTDTDKKCNPGYVDYETGEYEIILNISEKDNPDSFIEKSIIIKNILNEEIIEEESGTGKIEETNSGILENDKGTGSTNLEVSGTLVGSQAGLGNTDNNISDFSIIFQQPTYLLEKDLIKQNYICDREECKVNIKLENLDGTDISSKYSCEIDFGFGADILKTCNPTTIVFPIGEYQSIFKVLEKDNPDNFIEKIIFIKNIIQTSSSSGSGGGNSNENSYQKEIEIQSGLQKKGVNYFCSDKRCKVNLKYDNSSKETCEWDFGISDFNPKYKTTCNPGFLYFPNGEYFINLKITNSNGQVYYKNLNIENNYLEIKKENNHKPISKIILQGRVGKNKNLEGNKLLCYEKEDCSVNFSGKESYDLDEDNLIYFWDFGNDETSNKSNPLSLKYIPGEYEISLRVEDEFGLNDISYFYLEVIGEEEYEFELDKNIFGNLKVGDFLVNPKGVDNYEWIEIINSGTGIINLNGLLIDDIFTGGSKPFIIKKDLFLNAGSKKRFYKSETKINLNNTGDEINLIYDENIVDNISWNFSVPDNYLLNKERLSLDSKIVKVLRVIDGDTIEIEFDNGKKQKVRFIGVDTPETKDPRKEVQFYGEEASNFTKKFLEGKTITLEFNKDNLIDKYSRLLAYIYIDCKNLGNIDKSIYQSLSKSCEKDDEKVFFNKLLIQEGQARAYLKFPFKYAKEFDELEKKARKEGLGLWANKELKNEFLKENREDRSFFKSNFETSFYKKSLSSIKEKTKKIQNYLITKTDFISINISFWGTEDKKELVKNKENENTSDKIKRPNFSQNIAKQKKSLKIYGKTIANTKIILDISGKQIEINSDEKGNYSYKNDSIQVGEYIVKSKVYDSLGNIYEIPRIKNFEIDKTYYLSMQSYKNNGNSITSIKRPNFSQSIAKQKKSLKIYGKTIANTKIILDISGKQIEINSDEKGNYSYKNDSIQVGEYIVKSKVYDSLGNIYEIPRIKNFEIDEVYYLSMQSYKKSNNILTNVASELKIVNKAKAVEKTEVFEKKDKNFSFYLLNLLLGILVIMLGFLIYKRHSHYKT